MTYCMEDGAYLVTVFTARVGQELISNHYVTGHDKRFFCKS